MKILLIHADFIEWEAKRKALKDAEEDIAKGKQRVDECLVVLTSVEKRDESDPAAIVQRMVQEIKNVAQQVNAKNIVLYPYAHLSSELGAPKIALQILKDAEQALQEKYLVKRVPFGWYKAFTIANKGHPLSELSRSFTVDEKAEKSAAQSITQSTTLSAPSLQREYKDESFLFQDTPLSPEEKLKLTAAYVIAAAVKELHPEAHLGSVGFYHDQVYVDIARVKLTPNHFPAIEKKALLKKQVKIEAAPIQEIDDPYQKEIAADLGKKAAAFTFGSLAVVPSYADPFVPTQNIGALKLLNSGSAYWKNNEKNKQLTRLYLVAFSSADGLEEYLKKQQDAENRSHLKIGREQGLFVVSDLVGAGMPLLAPNGMIIRTEIVNFLWELHKHEGYKQVWTPHITKQQLYKTSGHWEKFGAELFHVKGREEEFVMKPMNCPHHMQIFAHFAHSYRDLPIRFFEPATVYRDEKSGQLIGLSRVRAITQDDGHLFCRISQITEEAKKIVTIIHKFYKVMGMDKGYWVALSVRGADKSKYLGTDEVWKIAESALESAAKESKLPYRRIEGEAAFYGPKLDFVFKDALGREWQLATIQCDFNLPERFQLSYMNEEGKKERPVVIHRAISGSLERFMSILIEHFAGKFPLWLSPVQVKVLTITDRHLSYAQEVLKKLQEQDIRAELDERNETMGKKVREAQLQKVNYILTIGDKELAKRTVAIRARSSDETTFDVPLEKFIGQVVNEVKERKL